MFSGYPEDYKTRDLNTILSHPYSTSKDYLSVLKATHNMNMGCGHIPSHSIILKPVKSRTTSKIRTYISNSHNEFARKD